MKEDQRDLGILGAGSGGTWEGGPSFSLRNRLYRLAFALAWALLARWTPPPLYGWRRLILTLFGARLSPTARVYGSAHIWSPRNLVMADYALIGPEAKIYSMATITIGAYAIVSQRAHLCAGSHDVDDFHFQLRARPIRIGFRAWIAAEAFVGPGVTVGQGAVLSARGCAFRDLAEWTIFTGNPAVPFRERRVRFDDASQTSDACQDTARSIP